MPNDSKLILLTGPTGYVGGRLLRVLESTGNHVRCLSRHPETLNQRVANEVEPSGLGSLIRQTAIFDPVGLFGQLYWYFLYPVHQMIFAGMLRGIVRAMGECR